MNDAHNSYSMPLDVVVAVVVVVVVSIVRIGVGIVRTLIPASPNGTRTGSGSSRHGSKLNVSNSRQSRTGLSSATLHITSAGARFTASELRQIMAANDVW